MTKMRILFIIASHVITDINPSDKFIYMDILVNLDRNSSLLSISSMYIS